LSEKRKYLGKENGADRKEHWMARVKDLPDGHLEKLSWPKLYRDNIWPQEMPGLKPAVAQFYELSLPITIRILQALAVRLGRDRHYFDNIVEGPTITRLNHYFSLTPGEVAEGQIWGGEHCDIDFITGPLDSDGPGLWLQRGDGEWIPLARPEGYVTYQYGDMLERESGGIVRSTPHKVVPVGPHIERWSIAPFGHPPCSQAIGVEGSDDPALTKRVAGDVLTERLFSTGMAM
jgi:isopenicillin N synthase-like dioxygenase